MKKYRIPTLILTLALILCALAPMQAYAIEPIEIEARHAVLYDATNGELLFEQAGHTKAYPASITKVMTALLVVEAIERGELSLDQMITCSETAWQGLSIYGSTQDIRAGEALSVRDLLHCLLLASANEAANILAEAVSGDTAAFVTLMNRRAGELGCEGTRFANAHGLHDDDHYTTAYDIALFFTEAMRHELFAEISATTYYETAPTARKDARKFYNTHPLLSTLYYSGYYYSRCIGGKTGTTDEAGGCLVSAAVDGDEYLISVVLGGEVVTNADGSIDRKHYSESKRLLRWGFINFERKVLSPEGSIEASVAVTLSEDTDSVLVRPRGTISRTLPVDVGLDDIDMEVRLFKDSVQAPVEEGQLMGTLTLTYEGEDYGTLDLVALNDVERSDFLYWKMSVEEFFRAHGAKVIFAAVAVIVLLIGARIAYGRSKSKRMKEAVRSGSYSGKRK